MTRRALGPVLRLAVIVAAVALSVVRRDDDRPGGDHRAPADEPPTTVFAPAGTTAELLAQLAAETGGARATGSSTTTASARRWPASRRCGRWSARPSTTERPELLEGFDTVIDLVRRSVERRRPADADKAHKNLLTLIAAYER